MRDASFGRFEAGYWFELTLCDRGGALLCNCPRSEDPCRGQAVGSDAQGAKGRKPTIETMARRAEAVVRKRLRRERRLLGG